MTRVYDYIDEMHRFGVTVLPGQYLPNSSVVNADLATR